MPEVIYARTPVVRSFPIILANQWTKPQGFLIGIESKSSNSFEWPDWNYNFFEK